MKKSGKIILAVCIAILILLLLFLILGAVLMPKLLSSTSSKLCCEEIGGTISGKNCIFKDLDGRELNVALNSIENYNGKNYCTDEYFDRK